MPVWSTFGAMSRLGFSSPSPPLPIFPGATVYLDAATPTSYSGTGSNINDLTANSNNGTIIGGVTYTGTAGGSWLLDGKSGFIRLGPLLNSGIATTSYTMGIWVSPHTQVGNVVAMAAQEPSDGWQMPPIVMDQQRFVGNVWSNDIAQPTAYTLGNWYYLTLVWDNANSQKRFYVNGALVQTLTSVTYSSSGVSNYLGLGKNIEQAAANRGWLKGHISHFHFYGGTALTDAQVLFNYNALSSRHTGSTLTPVNTTNLGLYVDANRLGSANGTTTWTDLSGAGLNLVGPIATQLTTRDIASQQGNVLNGGLISPGGLISNGGSGGGFWVSGNTTILDTDIHTVAMWLKFNSSTAWPNGWNNSWEKFFTHYSAGAGSCCGGERSPSAWRYPSQRFIHWRYDPGNSDGDLTATSLTNPAATPDNPERDFVLDTWYQVCWVKNGGTLVGYVNGVSVGSTPIVNPKLSVTNPIGLFEAYSSASMQIDGLLVYNRALSGAEVLANYNALAGRYIHYPNNYRLVFSVDASNPKSYPGTGTSTFEISGRQLTGTMSNVTFDSTPTNFTGGAGGAWTFNGSTSFISFPYDSIHDVAGNGVTAEVWVKPANFGQNGFFIEKGQVNSQYSLFISGAQLLWRTVTSVNGLSDINVNPNSYMNTTEWHHVVGTYSSGNKKLYINGVLIQTQTGVTGTINNNGNGIWLGKHAIPDSYFYNGQIGEARIYNRQLSDAQVLYNYNVTKGRYAKASLPVPPELYAFTSFTFTNAGATGNNGPSLAQVQSAYSGTSWTQSTSNLNTSSGTQLWTVPKTGTYRIEVAGARGGGNGGLGARLRGDFALTSGEVIKILVGQQGLTDTGSSQGATGGGGGTFVARNDNTLLIAAGGGGGNGHNGATTDASVINAVYTNNGQNGASVVSPGGLGGTSGNGGLKGVANSNPENVGGGGGYSGNGGGTSSTARGGNSFTNNGSAFLSGGFGGGGGGFAPAYNCGTGGMGGGGGGGYSGGGGGGTNCNGNGGGGGSYNIGTNATNIAIDRTSSGYVTITVL